MPTPLEIVRRLRTRRSHRLHSLPVLVLSPHSRCNCRCVMCDIWLANRQQREISKDVLERHLRSLDGLHVQSVVLTGGEPLMHSNLWSLCSLLTDRGVKVTLLSTGLLLSDHVREIARFCDEVIVSLDGGRATHDAIRRVPDAYDRLLAGVRALVAQAPGLPITARSVIQRLNYRELPAIAAAAREIGVDRLSFLPADVSSEAFNRPQPWTEERGAEVALSLDEARDLEQRIEAFLETNAADFRSGWIAESPKKMRAIARYYLALHGAADFQSPICNAPWVSSVVEADGTVRPCFFHRPLGHLDEQPLADILNSKRAIDFRRQLDVGTDPVCARCVCSLYLSPRAEAP